MISRTTMERREPKPENIRMSYMHYCAFCTRLKETKRDQLPRGWIKIGDDELCDKPTCYSLASQAKKQLAHASTSPPSAVSAS